MNLSNEDIRKFFSIFNKHLTNSELSLIKSGKGDWTSSDLYNEYIDFIKKYLIFFKLCPSVKAVFLCNTLAFHSISNKSDIDLFIVTSDRGLWITRVFITLILSILRVRRHGCYTKKRFCLSFFATESGALALNKIQIRKNNDPYLAIWTVTLDCIIGNLAFVKKFQSSNNFIKNYGVSFSDNSKYSDTFFVQKMYSFVLEKLRINNLFKIIFIKRCINKSNKLKNNSGIIINDRYLKFHNNDIRLDVFNKIKNK